MAAVNVVFFQEGDSLDGSSENTGLITISAKPETLGQVSTGVTVQLLVSPRVMIPADQLAEHDSTEDVRLHEQGHCWP